MCLKGGHCGGGERSPSEHHSTQAAPSCWLSEAPCSLKHLQGELQHEVEPKKSRVKASAQPERAFLLRKEENLPRLGSSGGAGGTRCLWQHLLGCACLSVGLQQFPSPHLPPMAHDMVGVALHGHRVGPEGPRGALQPCPFCDPAVPSSSGVTALPGLNHYIECWISMAIS